MQRPDCLLDELEEMFDRIDEDGDRRIDTNHDGNISFDELRAWWTHRHPTGA